ncbi:hypothetical protein GGS23DRAFT_616426 [Durotheca rogersii]|uniref:uncharacterized protein n=1 Tax=Durotheca rogersii TaxID=419775 RepID=UPI00221F6FC6|nr:uncharacterized protein GGS23DRAFT_616426 [Durotheca rogersii]KAI5858261.1 hypothetical protein GGS23DRAFT_616426 [Durotheca rogersii]
MPELGLTAAMKQAQTSTDRALPKPELEGKSTGKLTMELPYWDSQDSGPTTIVNSDGNSIFPTPLTSPMWPYLADSADAGHFRPDIKYIDSAFHKEYRPLFYKYGIEYDFGQPPYPSYGSRTVVITGLPPDTAVSAIMAGIRGGPVLKVTTATSPAGFTARVQFVDSYDACAYDAYTKRRSTPSPFGGNARIELTDTVSFPIADETAHDIMAGMTRLVVVREFSRYSARQFLDSFQFMFLHHEELFEDVWMDGKGVLHLLFRDLASSASYFKTVLHGLRHVTFRDRVFFAADPCDAPLGDLQYPPRLARGLYPSLLDDWADRRKVVRKVGFARRDAGDPAGSAAGRPAPVGVHQPIAPCGSPRPLAKVAQELESQLGGDPFIGSDTCPHNHFYNACLLASGQVGRELSPLATERSSSEDAWAFPSASATAAVGSARSGAFKSQGHSDQEYELVDRPTPSPSGSDPPYHHPRTQLAVQRKDEQATRAPVPQRAPEREPRGGVSQGFRTVVKDAQGRQCGILTVNYVDTALESATGAWEKVEGPFH